MSRIACFCAGDYASLFAPASVNEDERQKQAAHHICALTAHFQSVKAGDFASLWAQLLSDSEAVLQEQAVR